MLVIKTIDSPKASWSDFRKIHSWLGIALTVVDVNIKVKIGKIDSHLIDVALRVLMKDLTVDSGTEKCLIIEHHLFLNILVGYGWYSIHDV